MVLKLISFKLIPPAVTNSSKSTFPFEKFRLSIDWISFNCVLDKSAHLVSAIQRLAPGFPTNGLGSQTVTLETAFGVFLF
jgi:hypothetical protein